MRRCASRSPLRPCSMPFCPRCRRSCALIESLRDQQLLLLAAIRDAVISSKREAEVQLVQTIPGYGEKTAATIVACVPEDLRAWGPKQKVGRKTPGLLRL